MIQIINIGGNPLGESKYEIKINNEHIAYFTHNRPAGLAICLEQAANAVHRAKWVLAAKLLRGENDTSNQKKRQAQIQKHTG